MKKFALSYGVGFCSALPTREALRLFDYSSELTKAVVAPDDVLDPLASIGIYQVVKYTGLLLELKGKKRLGSFLRKYAAGIAIGAGVAYEIVENILGRGIMPSSNPCLLGSVKDTFCRSAAVLTLDYLDRQGYAKLN